MAAVVPTPPPELEALLRGIDDAAADTPTRVERAEALRKHVEEAKDADIAPPLSALVPQLLQILRTGHPSFVKDEPEYNFRRTILDIILRVMYADAARFPYHHFFGAALHIVRTDNEENATAVLKTLADCGRVMKSMPAESLAELSPLFSELCRNLVQFAPSLFTPDRPTPDPQAVPSGMRSVRVVTEMTNVILAYVNVNRVLPTPNLLGVLGVNFQILEFEVPIQKQTRQEHERLGGVWAGMSPQVTNEKEYEDLMVCQTRMSFYVTYALKTSPEHHKAYGDQLMTCIVRLMQDVPMNTNVSRKDILGVFRNCLAEHRRGLVVSLEKVLDERVLVGGCMSLREAVLGMAYTALADALSHMWTELAPAQILRVVEVYCRVLHNPGLIITAHTAAIRLLHTLVEVLPTKMQGAEVARVLNLILETVADRMEVGCVMHGDALARLTAATKEGEGVMTIDQIEKSRPVQVPIYATERPDLVVHSCRDFFMQSISLETLVLKALRKCGAPNVDGTTLSRLFRSSLTSLGYCSPPTSAEAGKLSPEVLERLKLGDTVIEKVVSMIGHMVAESSAPTLQEVWQTNMDFFFERVHQRAYIWGVAQYLLSREDTSPILLPIVLRRLMDRLEDVGGTDEDAAGVLVRGFRGVFQAVTKYPAKTQGFLAAHLGRIVMDSFPLAAKAARPSNYYHLVRALFRAMGMHISNMEALFTELVACLPELLQSLDRQLHVCDPGSRDQIVELFLNIPVRLTNLLTHLYYLMRPLALALRGTPELVSLGLRTLELCIDHLTADFLDPILDAELRAIHEALHALLRAPSSAQVTTAVIRVLGKLGGRNRKLLYAGPVMAFSPRTDIVTMALPFDGRSTGVDVKPGLDLACTTLQRPAMTLESRAAALRFMKTAALAIIQQNIETPEAVEDLSRSLRGACDCLHIPELQVEAEAFIRQIALHVFLADARRVVAAMETQGRRWPSPHFSALIDTLPSALVRTVPEEQERAQAFVTLVITDLINAGSESPQAIADLLRCIAARFNTMCLGDGWGSRTAGCRGIQILLELPMLGVDWVRDREVDLVRTLLHVLKHLPSDLPKDVEQVTDLLTFVLRTSHGDPPPDPARSKLPHVMSVLFTEIPSQSATVREVAQRCIALVSELTGESVHTLLLPHRERALMSLYTKPLRALQYSTQIGVLEAFTYSLGTTPPIPDVGAELLRLLQETVAYASAEEGSLVGRANARQNMLDVVKLKVSCLRLLAAALPVVDYFSGIPNFQARVTESLFRSLYSPHAEIMDAGRQGLMVLLKVQQRIPSHLITTGLKPLLGQLSDTNKLSVDFLKGLAVLLEPLQNFFKLEVGQKLLEHFRVIADPQTLQSIAGTVVVENENIKKLVGLANVFHLLPSNANIYLEDLANMIMNTEAHFDSFSPSPFTLPLSRFLCRYPEEGVAYFLRNLQFARHLRTLRNVLQARSAERFRRELATRGNSIISDFLSSAETVRVVAGLTLCVDLADVDPRWLIDHPEVVNALLAIWRNERLQPSPNTSESRQKCLLISQLLRKALEETPRVDLLFDLIAIFSRDLPIDTVQTARFFYEHVALQGSLSYRRNVLSRFVTWIEGRVSWTDKLYFIRIVLTPMLQAHVTRSAKEGLLDSDIISCLFRCFWQPDTEEKKQELLTAGNLFLIELLHLTSVIVTHYSYLLEQNKKELIQFAWSHVNSPEIIVKQSAHVLAARLWNTFEAPDKFIRATLSGLLKQTDADAKKSLTEQGLDVIVKVFPRMTSEDPDDPAWAQAMRRLLSEETIGAPQTTAIYSFMVRHPDTFYPVRSLFVPHMVHSVNRLGFFGNQNPDARVLTLDLIEVLFNWEKQAAAAAESNNSMDVDDGNTSDQGPWTMSLAARENVVSYLVRLAVTLIGDPSPTPRSQFATKALSLVKQILGASGWKDVTVKLNYYLRPLETDFTDANSLQAALGAARVLQVVCADKDDAWYQENAPMLQRLIRKGLMVDSTSVALLPIFERLFQLYPLRKDLEEATTMLEFHDFIRSTLSEHGVVGASNMRPLIQMFASIARADPESLAILANTVVKLVQRFCKEHADMSDDSVLAPFLITLMDLVRASMAHLGEQKRVLWISVGYVVDRCKNLAVCTHILDIAREFALERSDPFPTHRDKASLFLKMIVWELFFPEKRVVGPNQPLVEKLKDTPTMFTKYLEVIYQIYADPALRRSDLTSRLEGPFLLGCRARDLALREKFVTLLDSNVPRSLFSRLSYIIGSQGWDPLNDHNWSYLASYLLLGAVNIDAVISPALMHDVAADLGVSQRAEGLVEPWRHMLVLDTTLGHDTWVSLFPAVWTHLSRREQVDLTHHMIALLSKDYHHRQAELRPNVIQTLLEGVHKCVPAMILPPHLVKFLAKNFGAWHVALEILIDSLEYLSDEPSGRDIILDALAELYAELSEEDAFYGLWRRRAIHSETSIGMALEENGMWEQASTAYEHALIKAKSGSLVFTEPEYCLWEDHWILAQEKLQQWDVLYDLGRNEGNNARIVEAAWRCKNWSDTREQMEEYVSHLPDVATPRRCVFSAFLSLLKPHSSEQSQEFAKHVQDSFRLTVHRWKALPNRMSHAHVPLLQHFQQGIELQEAVQIFNSLSTTNAQNLDKKSQDLKLVLQAWRERLPSPYDDISIWSDLVAWRRNVFNAINAVYLPLVQQTAQNGTGGANTSTLGYRGFHETAWIINRFAHVARKHELLDACHTQLTSIYQLPNIEISEAFLKLREQARCHYLKPEELASGLEVVNNTNLMYFSSAQKAEFFTLKGMFHAKAERMDDANNAFGQAVQTDMHQAKAWAQWGKFNDRLFKQHKTSYHYGANAVSCYLQAAGLYKSGKSRPLLARVLWLISIDDDRSISNQFDQFKGDAVYWYWITFIPQLCLASTYGEVKQARHILMQIAGLFPQALFYTLRGTRDEFASIRKSAAAARGNTVGATVPNADGQDASAPTTVMTQPSPSAVPDTPAAPLPAQAGASQIVPSGASDAQVKEGQYIEEVAQRLKTAFPLLVLTLETVVDQFSKRFKATPEEEQYRMMAALVGDALQTFMRRSQDLNDDGTTLPEHIERVLRHGVNIPAGPLRDEFENDFVKSKPNQLEYLRRLQSWRARYEKDLDARPKSQSLDLISHYLTEFHYGKFDDIEIPGQYTESRDTNSTFVRVQKFCPTFDNCRTNGQCYRRLTILGSDYSKTSFAVRPPTNRGWRREERLHQIFRTFNVLLGLAKETRKRNLSFCIPATVQIAPSLRLEHNSAPEVYFSDIFDQHCEETGISREEAAIHTYEKIRQAMREFRLAHGRAMDKTESYQLKMELFNEITTKMVPDTVLTRYMSKTMAGPSELWTMRKQFASQLATSSFMTFLFAIPQRTAARFTVSRESGKIVMHELIPGLAHVAPVYTPTEVVPFRFTPNMQRFIGPIFTEGIMSTGIMAIGRALTDPEDELEQQLCLFSRDEVYGWLHSQKHPAFRIDINYRQKVEENTNAIVQRAAMAACTIERQQQVAGTAAPPPGPSPVQSVTNLIAQSTNPYNLVKMSEVWLPWF